MHRRAGPIDFWILLPCVLLLGIGIVMIFSASALTSTYNYGDPYFFSNAR